MMAVINIKSALVRRVVIVATAPVALPLAAVIGAGKGAWEHVVDVSQAIGRAWEGA